MDIKHLVFLTSPEGEVAIVKSKIVAVVSTPNKFGDDSVKSQIYVDGDQEPFNILENFEYVYSKI